MKALVTRKKGAIGHIEIIISFIIFVGFLIFLFFMFNPNKKSEVNESMLYIIEESLRKYTEISVLSASVILNTSNEGYPTSFQPCFQLGGLSNTSIIKGNSDVILVTDVSGSMDWTLNSTSESGGDTEDGIERDCNDPLLFDNSTKRISLANCLAKNFTSTVLGIPGNRMGLASFFRQLDVYHPLDDDRTKLINHIDLNYNKINLKEGTCVCCGMNAAYNLLAPRNDSRRRYIVLMTDGLSFFRCTDSTSSDPPSATCGGPAVMRQFNGTDTIGSSCPAGKPRCINLSAYANFNNTIWSANRSHVELNATVFTIGMAISDCLNADWTLSESARVGEGIYRSSYDAKTLADIYNFFAESIIQQFNEPLNAVIPLSYKIAAENYNQEPVSSDKTGVISIQFNGSVYKIYFSEYFNETGFDTSKCSVLTRDNYSLGLVQDNVFVFKNLILNLNESYTSDYQNLKNDLQIPSDFDFGFIIRDSSGSILMKAVNRRANKIHVLAQDIPLEMIDENGRIQNIIMNLQVW